MGFKFLDDFDKGDFRGIIIITHANYISARRK